MRLFRNIGAGLLLAIALVLASLSAAPSSAHAASEPTAKAPVSARAGYHYGALALSIDGAYGKAKNYRSRAAAYHAAVGACNRHTKYHCARIGWVRNACAAMWYKIDGRGYVVTKGYNKVHYGWARTVGRAKTLARHGRHGGVVRSVCTAH